MTVRDAVTVGPSERLNAEVVVVGSGPAGLTTAIDLSRAGVDVIVLESGSWDVSNETRDLDEGEVVGEPLRFSESPWSTAAMRMRAVGGASGHWTGMCRPLDEIDMRARTWLPRSGWPIDRRELDPWYRRAEQTLQLGETGWDASAWFERAGVEPVLRTDQFDTVVYQFSPPVQFGLEFEAVLRDPAGPRLLIGATAVDATVTGRRVSSLTVRRSDGGTFDVVPDRAIVLAVGGLEVPRLLLAWGGGIANSSGLVGVGYADHPHRAAGQVRVRMGEQPPLYAWSDAPGEDPPAKVWAGWSPTAELQESEQLVNSVALLRFSDAPASGLVDPSPVTGAIDGLVEWANGTPVEATLSVRTEQAFSSTSRVSLSDRRDATGLPRLRLDWQPGPEEGRTARRVTELLAAEFGRAGIGRIEVDPRGRPFGEIPIEIGCHPMGAARMSTDPAGGVVGADLRSHDLENLFVCSSAVFPTGGHANPTLTIVALAHRLAAHLQS